MTKCKCCGGTEKRILCDKCGESVLGKPSGFEGGGEYRFSCKCGHTVTYRESRWGW